MLKGRASSRSINPTALPVALGGYGPDHSGSHIAQPLEVNCLCLEDETGLIVLASVDLLYVTHDLRAAVISQVRDFGLDGSRLFFAASHTHYAPALDSTKPRLGRSDPQYLQHIAAVVVEAVRDAALGPKDVVTLTLGQGTAAIGVNRRKRRVLRLGRRGIEVNRVGLYPNPAGPVDPITTLVTVRSGPDVVAHLWSACCHPTGLADGECVSSHFPGVVRESLRSVESPRGRHGTAVPVLYLQGFSGDVRPQSGCNKRGTMRTWAKRVLTGPAFEPMNDSEYSAWARYVAGEIVSIPQEPISVSEAVPLAVARTELPASWFARGAEGLPPVSFHLVSIGPVTIVGASAELVSGYASKVRDLAPHQHVITVGCIDHVIGYWPLQHMFREGGYEVVHHCPSFSIEACDPDIESTVMEQFGRLLGGRATDVLQNPIRA